MPGNHVLLETIQLTQNASSVLFDNIPQTGYTDLKIIVSARSTRSGAQEDGLGVRLNSSTTGYTYKILGSSGGSTFQLNTAYEQTWVCNIPAANTTASIFSATEVYITNYTDSTPKTYSTDSGAEHNGATGYLSIGQMTQSTAAPVTSLTLLAQNGNLLAGSTFSLYGIAAKNTTPAIAPKATGGNIVANDGTYWYHAFLNSGYFTPQASLTCNILQIAGGGGGGSRSGGGGGAGGISYITSEALIVVNYPVTVGAGGAGGSRSVAGTNGGNSQFASLTAAIGGGVGGSAIPNTSGSSGGSGGGGSNNGAGSAGTSGQGFAGGSSNSNSYDAGGGGGAGAVGANASTGGLGSGAGAGGAGVNTYSSWASPTSTGVSGFYAGGGGGGSFGSSNHGAGGAGGGGAGADSTPTNGTQGTGGGGGGAGNSANTNVTPVGANGGSGIVIIRYPMA